MSVISNIEWFSVEEKQPPTGIKLFLATDETLDFDACIDMEDKKIYFADLRRIIRKYINYRYWAFIPSYPGPEGEAKKHWLSGHYIVELMLSCQDCKYFIDEAAKLSGHPMSDQA
ncbi:MAG: hypothetical protein HZB33_06105 [Nitrospirae bacterium]|nr:hypothetical protein [Nitrospirota bacterium]